MNKLPRYEERELKLRCTDATIWDQIMKAQSLLEKAVPESEAKEVLETHYFDTESACLQKAKIAYRIRREGEQWIATVKGGGSSRGGLHERYEWNVLVSNPQPDITVFAGTAMGKKIMTVVGQMELMEKFVQLLFCHVFVVPGQLFFHRISQQHQICLLPHESHMVPFLFCRLSMDKHFPGRWGKETGQKI